MITSPEKITNLTDISYVKFQFQAPSRPGRYPFSLFVKSDAYVGLDVRKDVYLVVDEGKAENDYYEDEISEPDEDTLAGQMAAMKKQQGGGGGGGGGARRARESDTSDDE